MFVQVDLPALPGQFRWEAETVGLIGLLTEVALADVDGVVPNVQILGPGPGLGSALVADSRWWRLSYRIEGASGAFSLVARRCDAADRCTERVSPLDPKSPFAGVADQVGDFATLLGRDVEPEVREGWERPMTVDAYAQLVGGRSAAVFYGVLPSPDAEAWGNRQRDPIERAVYLDPGMGPAQWIKGRAILARGLDGAVDAFQLGVVGQSRVALRAALAEAHGRSDQWEQALRGWEGLVRDFPEDPRFVVPHAKALIETGRAQVGADALDQLDIVHHEQREVARLRVRAADGGAAGADYEALLVRWQRTDRGNPEPVRRRVHRRIGDQLWTEAQGLLVELEARGADDEAARLRMALATALSEWGPAAETARTLGEPEVAARIEARAARIAGQRPDPAGLIGQENVAARLTGAHALLDGGEVAQALSVTEGVLARHPWDTDGLALKAEILAAMGRKAQAEQTIAQLRFVDPRWTPPERDAVSGPHTDNPSR